MLITQSIVKAIEQGCSRKVYDQYVDGNQRGNFDMEKGSFFETICLGSGAKGVITNSLQLLKSGEKSADQKRIEEQAQRFLNMFNPSHSEFSGHHITHKQLDITVGNKKGTIDFITPGIIWDLKLTNDIDGYWSDANTIDLIQQVHYSWLYKEFYGVDMESRLLIFDYSTKMKVKEVKINISDKATQDCLSRFERVEDMVSEWELGEWPRVPSGSECSKCSLFCDKRVIKDSIIYQEINL